MSKKVLFYLVLDSLGIALTAFIGKYLCKISDAVTNPWVSNGISLVVNFLCVFVCVFIILFFLLYWWSDRKWSRIKKRFNNDNSKKKECLKYQDLLEEKTYFFFYSKF